MALQEIDTDGLDEMDKRVLEALVFKFGGGPVGLDSLSVAVGEDASTIEDMYEPYLIMQGFLKRTPRGRVAMPLAYHKFGAPVPPHTATQAGRFHVETGGRETPGIRPWRNMWPGR